MNHPSRTYGDIDKKDLDGSVLLFPWEKPRSLDPYVEPGNPCPKCNHTDSITWRFNKASRCMVVECGYCGYYKEQFTGVAVPLTEDMKKEDFANRKDTICSRCGKEFNQLKKKNHTLCPKCRISAYQKKYQREYGRKLRLEAKTNTDLSFRRRGEIGSAEENVEQVIFKEGGEKETLFSSGGTVSCPGNVSPINDKEAPCLVR